MATEVNMPRTTTIVPYPTGEEARALIGESLYTKLMTGLDHYRVNKPNTLISGKRYYVDGDLCKGRPSNTERVLDVGLVCTKCYTVFGDTWDNHLLPSPGTKISAPLEQEELFGD